MHFSAKTLFESYFFCEIKSISKEKNSLIQDLNITTIIVYIILSIYIHYSFCDVLLVARDIFLILYLTSKKISSKVGMDKKKIQNFTNHIQGNKNALFCEF